MLKSKNFTHPLDEGTKTNLGIIESSDAIFENESGFVIGAYLGENPNTIPDEN